jgi:enoyl-CoA hydratase
MQTLSLEKKSTVWILKINRPESLNALNSQVLKELDEFLTSLEGLSAKDLQVLILTGAGEKAFVAGADIKELSGLSQEQGLQFARKGQEVFRKIEKLKIPVIAAVNGFALGGGLELAMSCDFIVASENAKMGLPETSLGLIPGFGGTVRLTKYVGAAQAKKMIYTGEMLKADQAQALGLCVQVVPQDQLLSTCEAMASQMTSKGPLAIALAKKSILCTQDQSLDAAMSYEASLFSELFQTKDVKEGTRAFIEKRKAQFIGE